tara:strand:- start:824 stop:1417 length:594 start_codon:yes stop_codon:yes gene_type:complete
MLDNQNSPKEIFQAELQDLRSAVKDAAHDYHLFTVATSLHNIPEIRTVVLRDIDLDKYKISFHTDSRSPKYNQLIKNSSVSALFYSVNKKTQIRIKGKAEASKNKKLLSSLWNKLSKDSKECYQGKISPSGIIPDAKILNDIIDDPYADSDNQGFENFSRVTIDVSSFEILRLHHLGHKRLLCDLSKNNTNFQWIAS